MNFNDSQVQKCYDSTFNQAGKIRDDLGQVRALMATHSVFEMFEGAHSARVNDVIVQLLLPAVRPELRRWFRRVGAESDSATLEFRDRLSQLAGERLESSTDVFPKPK